MRHRPLWDVYFMRLAIDVSTRSTCLRRQVGSILVDKRNHIIATGYNGVAPGLPHCNYESKISEVSDGIENINPYACKGAFEKTGVDLDSCEAIHAEQNALLQCDDVYKIEKIYTTSAPCVTCTKLLMSTSCKEIIFLQDYPQWKQSKILWREYPGRHWKKLSAESIEP